MRVDRLNEHELITRITTARRSFDEMRRSPQIFGSSSVQAHRVFNPGTYDIEVTNIGFDNRVVEVVFTPDSDAEFAGGVVNLEYQMTYDTSGTAVEVIREDLPPLTSGPSAWRFYLSGSDAFPASWARLKFWVYSYSSGTLTVTLL